MTAGGIVVFQGGGDEPETQPGIARTSWRYWQPLTDDGAGQKDRWRTRLTSELPNTRLSFVGATGNWSYPVDVGRQCQWTYAAGPTGTETGVIVTDPWIAAPYPLIPTGAAEPSYAAVIVSRMILLIGAGVPSGTNGGIFGFLFGGVNLAADYTTPNAWNLNKWVGLCFNGAGVSIGYGDGAVGVLAPLPAVSLHVPVHVEHRLYPATATDYARYELLINGAVVGEVDFATIGTPRYAAAEGVNIGFLHAYTAAPAPAGVYFRGWEVGAGPAISSTVAA